MSEMIERVRRALNDPGAVVGFRGEDEPLVVWQARASIAAMREPTNQIMWPGKTPPPARNRLNASPPAKWFYGVAWTAAACFAYQSRQEIASLRLASQSCA